jgi:hypothetical protein
MSAFLLTLALAVTPVGPQGLPPARPDPLHAILVSRPRDPWVFRCVLDRKPRMVTLALAEDLWVAYDATNCGLARAWKGGVKFDGPVYTTVHGPQPTSIGSSYIEGFEGAVWEANVAGKDVPVRVQWRGYLFNGDHVALQYELNLPNAVKVFVTESPEFVRPETLFSPERSEELALQTGHPGLLRSFFARDIPDDTKITVKLRTDAESKLAESLERERFVDVVDAKGETRTQVISHLVLTKHRPSSNLVLYFAPIADEGPAAGPAKEGAK